jgi:hypothetical protein
MAKDGRTGNRAGRHILGLILAALGAVLGYFLARYWLSR